MFIAVAGARSAIEPGLRRNRRRQDVMPIVTTPDDDERDAVASQVVFVLRESLARAIDVAERDLFGFGSTHCDALVVRVMAAIGALKAPAAP